MTLLTAALAALLSASASAQSDPQRWEARLTAVAGDVAVYGADGSTEAVAGVEGLPLEEGDRVVVSSGSSAEVALDGDSLIALSAGSDFTLSKLSRAEAELSLAAGSLLAKIRSLGSDRLQVRTVAAVAAVRGTEFGVDVDGGGQSHVGVFDEGHVEVAGSAGAPQMLAPNQETSVSHGQAPAKPAALSRFAGRRAAMQAHRQRLLAIHRNWRPIPAARRRQMRRQARARQRARRRPRRFSGQRRLRAPRKTSPRRQRPDRPRAQKKREN